MNRTITFFLIFFPLLILSSESHALNRTKVVYESDQLIITRINRNTYQHVSFLQSEQWGKVACNGVIFVSNKESVVMDTPVDSLSSIELINWITERFGRPPIWVVPHHFHVDCTGGLSAFKARDIHVKMNTRTFARVKQPYQSTHVFFQADTLEIGRKQVILFYPGSGHTEDNIVSYLPRRKVLFGGCLVKSIGSGKGNLEDAVVEEWSGSIESILQQFPKVKVVIPGHGSAGGIELLKYSKVLFLEDSGKDQRIEEAP
jgi:metallo-beta-lactamase class B